MKKSTQRTISVLLAAILLFSLLPGLIVQAQAAEKKTVKFKEVCAGANAIAAIAENGDLYMWGYNEYGAIGNGEYGSKNNATCIQRTPYKVMCNVRYVTMGYYNTAAITTNGDLYIWGKNEFGQIGDGTQNTQPTPVKIMSNVRSVSLSSFTSVAVTVNNELYAWGSNGSGQIGNGKIMTSELKPVKIMDNVRTASSGNSNTAALTLNNELYLWGEKALMGGKAEQSSLTPVKVMDHVRSFCFGDSHVAAATESNDLFLWGLNSYGQLGNGTTNEQATPVKVLENVDSVSLANTHSAAKTTNGHLYIWGFNNCGPSIPIPDGPPELRLTPEKVLEQVKLFETGRLNTAAVTTNGDLYVWGRNIWGLVGDGTLIDQALPVKVLNNVRSISVGNFNTAAITTDGDLYVCGINWPQVADSNSLGTYEPFLQKLEIIEKPFLDVNPTDWFHDHVVYAFNRKLIYGADDTHFDPYATMTRCQLVSILYRLEGAPAVQGSSNFTDLEKGQYYVDAVTWAEENGIVYGVSKTKFDPHAKVTREQIVSFLYRYVEYKERDMRSTQLSGFSDYEQVSSYARPAMEWAVEHGIVYGTTSTTLSPKADAQRAQVAAFLYRLCLEYFR